MGRALLIPLFILSFAVNAQDKMYQKDIKSRVDFREKQNVPAHKIPML